jgi:hypothetical protein
VLTQAVRSNMRKTQVVNTRPRKAFIFSRLRELSGYRPSRVLLPAR